MGQETRVMNIRLVEICPSVWYLVPTGVSLWDAEQVNGWSPHVWFPPWSMEEVWWCVAGDTVCDLFRFQKKAHNQHGYHNILQRYTIPSGLHWVGWSFVFYRTMTQNTPLGCVRAIWPSTASDELASTITWPQPKWDGLGWVGPQREGKTANKCSAYVGTPSRLLEKDSRWSWLR